MAFANIANMGITSNTPFHPNTNIGPIQTSTGTGFGQTSSAPTRSSSGGGNVLSANNKATTPSGNSQIPTSAPVTQATQSSGGGGSNVPSLPNLDSIYAPIFAAYDSMTGQVNQAKGQDTTDLTNAYNQNKGLIPGYVNAGNQTIDASQQQLGNQLQSAYDQAARNYQWANAGALNQYGYNGAYLGGNAMAQQEMQREIGQVGQQGVQGTQQIGQQRTDLTNWANQQNATLDQQFSSAKDSLNQFFQQQLFAINNDRGQSEAQKAAGKVQLLQDVMNQNNQIQLQYTGFQQQLALLAQTGGQNYNMSPFLSQMGTTGSTINGAVNPANQSYGVLTGQNASNFTPYAATQKNNNDLLSQVLGGTGTSATLPTQPGFTGTGF